MDDDVQTPASLLAVVDDPEVRDHLFELAMAAGYGVYCASGALEALAVLSRERPGAVLVDLDMSNAKGLRFLNVFRDLRIHDDILCIAITARQGAVMPAEVKLIQKSAMGRVGEELAAHFA